MTFFSEGKVKFLAISEGEDIPTENFLLSLGEIVPFFGKFVEFSYYSTTLFTILKINSFSDSLGPTMFKPVKADISGNLKVTTEQLQGPSLF